MTQVATGRGGATSTETTFAGPVPTLTFKSETEEAVNFYVSLFKNSRIIDLLKSDGSGLIPRGKVLQARFVLDGTEFTAFDGGPSFSFTEGFSLLVTCQTQAEIDALWERLTEGGGEPGPCGWLKDRFGVSWQVVPAALGEMMSNPSKGNAAKMMEALLQMGKLDVAALRRAYENEA